jgi:hypothetical protein
MGTMTKKNPRRSARNEAQTLAHVEEGEGDGVNSANGVCTCELPVSV